jgi:hypothetical protein
MKSIRVPGQDIEWVLAVRVVRLYISDQDRLRDVVEAPDHNDCGGRQLRLYRVFSNAQ